MIVVVTQIDISSILLVAFIVLKGYLTKEEAAALIIIDTVFSILKLPSISINTLKEPPANQLLCFARAVLPWVKRKRGY